MKKYQTQLSYDYSNSPGTITDKVSATVPDRTMPVQKMLQRHVNGLSVEGQSSPQFYDENHPLAGTAHEGKDPRYIDLTDQKILLDEIADNASQVFTEAKEKIKGDRNKAHLEKVKEQVLNDLKTAFDLTPKATNPENE